MRRMGRYIPRLADSDAFLAGCTDVVGLVESHRPSPSFQDTAALLREGYLHTALLMHERRVQHARGLREAMVTDDLPILLAGTTNLRVQRAFTDITQNWRDVFLATSFNNFLPVTVGSLGELLVDDDEGNEEINGLQPEVPEGVGYSDARVGESQESAQISTYGSTFTLSRQMLINDDQRALTQIPDLMGASMARTINRKVALVLEENADADSSGQVMSDSYQLFDITHHGNMVNGDYPLNYENLLAQYGAFTTQYVTPMGVQVFQRPTALIVPPELLFTAEALINDTSDRMIVFDRDADGTATTLVSDLNRLKGRLKVVCLEELRDGASWYLAGAPNAPYATVEVGFLRGVQAPSLFTRAENMLDLHAADGQQYKIRHDFGAYAADWKSLRLVRHSS